jgi:nicotinate (nicotinamide) nucleotide adenylyltransferase
MEFFHRAPRSPRRLGVLPGSFNPPTKAHVLLATEALHHVDEVVWTLPRVFPHKPQFGATLDERIDMLRRVNPDPEAHSIAVTDGGLFLDIAQECRASYGPGTELVFICGRDAAERVLSWDYGRDGAVEEMLAGIELLVASRHGEYLPPVRWSHRVKQLPLPIATDEVSSTEVRALLALGQPWQHLVPEPIHALLPKFGDRLRNR